jgi:hypothetical protein
MLDDVEGPEQTSWVRILIILAIGIPILIEVVTFGGLLGHYVAGGGGDGGAASTPTPDIEGATAGDEILPETAAVERVDSASVVTGNDGWRFTLSVAVDNSGNSTYELRLGTATTRAGRTVEGSDATTGRLAPGETGSVTGSWMLPKGQRPASVVVTVVTTPDDGTASAQQYTVDIGDVPVSS